ncbi:LLM class flavin-dependent oxidoreductase [Streptomyces sp. 7N604]|uniref:LLM class flavin-dependent oxidoreductase n=1 Tax=Streptomyces sp. 7N604 TaxID=3457415 RepID=UPI003FD1D3F6
MLVPEHAWPRARSQWTLVEELGYDHAWTYDHLKWRWFADRAWHTSTPTMAAAASVTSRITIGALVGSPNFRHPVALARDLATLDSISEGRIVCGVGAGAPGFDASILGQPELTLGQRADRFAEFVELLDALLTQDRVDFDGTWYVAKDVVIRPSLHSRGRLPIALAASGRRGMALAAAFADIWVTTGPPNDFTLRPWPERLPEIAAQIKQVDEACERGGRDPASLRKLLVADVSVGGITASTPSYVEASHAFAELGITDLVVHWPRLDAPYEGDEEVLVDFARNHLTGMGT